MMKQVDDGIILTLGDLKGLYFRYFSQLRKVALLCGLSMFLFLLIRDPLYKAEATFQKYGKEQELFSLKEILKGEDGGDHAILSLMTSRDLLGKAISQLGMQAKVAAPHFFSTPIQRVRDNFLLLIKGKIVEKDLFVFKEIEYAGEPGATVFLKPLSPTSYQILSKEKELLCETEVGAPILFRPKGASSMVQMTLSRFPNTVEFNHLYSVHISPLSEELRRLEKKFKVGPSKMEKNVLSLTFFASGSPSCCSVFKCKHADISGILKKENEEICKKQLLLFAK